MTGAVLRSRRRILAAVGALLTMTGGAGANWRPARPLRLLVGFPPGGSADILARRLAAPLAVRLGQPVVVENRPGAGGNLAMEALARAPADGLTLAVSPVGPVAINPALLGPRLPYDAQRDFTPLLQVWNQPIVLAAHRSVPSASDGFLDWLRRRPDTAYGSTGIGSSNHLVGAMLSRELGLAMRHVPYRGTVPALADLMAGEILLSLDLVTGTVPLVRDGRIQAIAVTTRERSALLPDVPTLGEIGLPALEASSWLGLFAPAGLPREVTETIAGEISAILRSSELTEWLSSIGAMPVAGTPADFARFLAAERERWGAVVRATGVTLD